MGIWGDLDRLNNWQDRHWPGVRRWQATNRVSVAMARHPWRFALVLGLVVGGVQVGFQLLAGSVWWPSLAVSVVVYGGVWGVIWSRRGKGSELTDDLVAKVAAFDQEPWDVVVLVLRDGRRVGARLIAGRYIGETSARGVGASDVADILPTKPSHPKTMS